MDAKIERIEKVGSNVSTFLEDGREALLDEQAIVALAEQTRAFERLSKYKYTSLRRMNKPVDRCLRTEGVRLQGGLSSAGA